MKREKGHPLYWTVRGITKLVAYLYVRFRAIGAENVPATGGCILTPNHASFLDPPMVGCGIRHRVVHFMARDTLFKFPVIGWWYRKIGTIAIDRTKGDLAALRSAIANLKSGKVVCLFPEGTRSLDGELQTAKGGVGFLIAKAAVPVVPVYLEGTFAAWPKGAKWIKPKKVTVHYGKPIPPETFQNPDGTKPDYDQIVAMVMEQIAALKAACETGSVNRAAP
jgi:1-acyl-sn-glycerol-3-phosphate acyltransferase